MPRMTGQDQGRETTAWVSDRLSYVTPRQGDLQQNASHSCWSEGRNEKVGQAIGIMKENLEEPENLDRIAEGVGLSIRQLERLFKKFANKTPEAIYLELRLERARGLLLQTDLSTLDIGLACGFSSAGHFAKAYSKKFGVTPRQEQGSDPCNRVQP